MPSSLILSKAISTFSTFWTCALGNLWYLNEREEEGGGGRRREKEGGGGREEEEGETGIVLQGDYTTHFSPIRIICCVQYGS